MNILDRYISRQVLSGALLVAAVLATLGALFLFIEQQDDIGVGTYSTRDALAFALMTLPVQIYQLLPVSVLIGSMLGLGSLARGSELTVIRVAGVSVWRIAGSALIAGFLLTLLGIALGEFIGPPLQKLATQQKAFAKSASASFAGKGGAWVRDGNFILSVERNAGTLGAMLVFELSPEHRLDAVGRATSVNAGDSSARGWQLSGFDETRFGALGITAMRGAKRRLESGLSGDFLALASSDPNRLNTAELAELGSELKANGIESNQIEFAYWSRIARVAAIPFAVLLAIPFMFGSMRGAGAGAKSALGLLLGVVLFLAQDVVESGALVFKLNPMLLAWLPVGVMGVVALLLIARVNHH
jgi:lipopolysaccharide export system permease protein